MITRRQLLKRAGAVIAVSAAALAVIREPKRKRTQVYDRPMVQDTGFGLARPKREGGIYYTDPLDDPEYQSHLIKGGLPA